MYIFEHFKRDLLLFKTFETMRDDFYWTSRENSLELIELSSINKVYSLGLACVHHWINKRLSPLKLMKEEQFEGLELLMLLNHRTRSCERDAFQCVFSNLISTIVSFILRISSIYLTHSRARHETKLIAQSDGKDECRMKSNIIYKYDLM